MKILDWDIKISDYKFSVSDRYIVFGENDKFGIDQYFLLKDSLFYNDRFGVQSDLLSRYSFSIYLSILNFFSQILNRMGSFDDIFILIKLFIFRLLF